MKKYLLLFLIIVLGFFLRVYKVDTVPSGVLVDEAALGYNAYSVFKTGFDEHKIRYPLLFKSFGDYKPPAYFYSQLPFIKLFGSNNFSLRFPSVLAGTLLILVVFFLFNNLGFGFTTSLFAAALTAFSPWTIILSRFALESNLGLLFFGIGLTFTIKYLREDKILFAILAGVFFGLSWYGYIAYRMTTGLIIFFLFFYGFYKKLKPKNLIILVGVFFITIFPLFLTVFSKSTNARFYQIGLLADKGPVMEIIESRTFCREDLPKLLCYLNSNKATVLGRILFDRYLKTFSLDYLFVGGERSSGSYGVENFGLFSFFTIPLYLLGFIALFSHKKNKFIDTLKPLIFAGLLFGAMPSSIAGLPQKVRLSPLFPFVLILIVWGFELLREKFRGNTKTFYIFLSYFLVFYLCLVFLINFLTIDVRKQEIHYGNYIRNLMLYIADQKNTRIYMNANFSEPLIYYAYFSQYEPVKYQKDVKFSEPDGIGWIHAVRLDNIHLIGGGSDYIKIICEERQKPGRAILITNEKLIEDVKNNSILYIGKTENDAMSLVYAYDMKKFPLEKNVCGN